MKIRDITESASVGSTASGSVSVVEQPLGSVQKRTKVRGLQPAEKIMKGKAKKQGPYVNSISESKVNEEDLSEQDLIIVPGMRRMKDKSFISHKEDRRDHEVEMARSDLYAAAKDAMRIFKLLKDRSEEDGLMGWQQSYITLAADYLNSVADSIEYDAKVKGSLDEMTGGVIAGGQVQEEKCPHCGGEMVSEELINEKKDACYYKVKSRYKVWPSAYASGALVKCRKKGSKNWGKSKK